MTDHIYTAKERRRLVGNEAVLHRIPSYLDALDAERARAEKAEAILDHTQQWYSERVRKIEDVAKREGLWPEIAAILANGTASRQMPDGSFFYDPPTYAQQLNIAKHRAEKAEAERDQAIKALSKAAEARGRAEGKLAASELPGIIDGWKARAEKAEAERDQALARLAAVRDEAVDWLANRLMDWWGRENHESNEFLREFIPAAKVADPDAEAALQRVVDAAWNEAVEAAVRIADGWGNCARDDDMAREIRALKRPGAQP